MNLRLMLFSGVITALVGAGIGFGVSRIERDPSQIVYKSRYSYQAIYSRYFVVSGALVGFLGGLSLQCVKQLKDARDREMGIK